MKLTIITATYNVIQRGGEDALVRCVQSVASLAIAHEHIVLDGNSTDGTVEKLQALSSSVAAFTFKSAPDRGIYDALNQGLFAASGEYVYFLGADDYVCAPEVLGEYVERASKENAEVLVAPTLFSNGRIFPKNGGGFYEMASYMAYSHQGCIARTETLRSHGGFDINCRYMADYKLMLSVHLAGAKTIVGKKPFAMYDVNGVSSKPSSEREEEDDRIKESVYSLSEMELEDYKASSRLPFRVCRRLLSSKSAFTRAMGWRLLFSYGYRKHKTDRVSMRYLFGFKVFSHPIKSLRG